LDETLVHCIDDIERNPCDKDISVTFPNGETVKAGINIRPYALECLRKANESYQVVVFTASHKAYADVVLNMLDPTGELIQYRLYRDHCIRTEEGIYVKDLRIITNRNLKDLIIVDNAVYSFGYQLDNGIPIIPFYDDKSDEELMHLIFYFTCLAQCEDVREQNRKAFQLKDLQEIDIAEYLHSMMNSKRVAQVEQEV
jgi:CTD small phosphatase-like protein 2